VLARSAGERTIAIIAPSNSMAYLAPPLRTIGVRALESLGYRVRLAPNVDASGLHGAASVAERLADIAWAVREPDVELVMAVYGGYNSNQLLDRIDYEAIAASGKAFIGYSDVTSLLVAIGSCAHAPVIHGPAFASFCDPNLFPYTRDGFAAVMAGDRVTYRTPEASASDQWYTKPGFGPREIEPFVPWGIYRAGEASGVLVGGNLETLLALAGTPYFPETQGGILFLEDATGDKPAAFHRSMTQLAQIGIFRGLRGMMIGKAPFGSSLATPGVVTAILDEVLEGTHCPVLYDVACSHVDPMMTLPLFREATITTFPEPTVVVHMRPARAARHGKTPSKS
jgi:muramoyltetrapeptide carboxypeptidase